LLKAHETVVSAWVRKFHGGLDYPKIEEGLPFMTWDEAKRRITAGDDPEKVYWTASMPLWNERPATPLPWGTNGCGCGPGNVGLGAGVHHTNCDVDT